MDMFLIAIWIDALENSAIQTRILKCIFSSLNAPSTTAAFNLASKKKCASGKKTPKKRILYAQKAHVLEKLRKILMCNHEAQTVRVRETEHKLFLSRFSKVPVAPFSDF